VRQPTASGIIAAIRTNRARANATLRYFTV
jgi:hypothetical protein